MISQTLSNGNQNIMSLLMVDSKASFRGIIEYLPLCINLSLLYIDFDYYCYLQNVKQLAGVLPGMVHLHHFLYRGGLRDQRCMI